MLKNFANFTLSGRLPAFTVVFGFLIFALIFPLSAVVSGAALVLLTLQAGPRNSILILVASAIAFAILSSLILGNISLGAITVIAQLLPSFILASIFYSTRSLSLSFQSAAMLGAIIFILITIMFPNAQTFWAETLSPFFMPMLEELGKTTQEQALVINQTAKYMNGLLIASIVLVHSFILLFGYKLHSLANDNDQFSQDFKSIRLGKVLAILGLISGIWAYFAQSVLAAQLSGILIILFFLQGMVVIHTTCDTMTKGKLWLIITYILIFFVPQAISIVILLGLVETFFKLRPRVNT